MEMKIKILSHKLTQDLQSSLNSFKHFNQIQNYEIEGIIY